MADHAIGRSYLPRLLGVGEKRIVALLFWRDGIAVAEEDRMRIPAIARSHSCVMARSVPESSRSVAVTRST